MSEVLFDRARAAVSALLRLVEERRREEASLAARFDNEEEETQLAAKNRLRDLAARNGRETVAVDEAYEREQQELAERLRKQRDDEESAYATTISRLESD